MSRCTGYERSSGLDRREALARFGWGLGAFALAELLNPPVSHAKAAGAMTRLHHPPRAKRVIFLCQSGAPSQMDLLDYKPELNRLHGTELPDDVRKGQRLTGMSGSQASLPLVGSPFTFQRYGQAGHWFSQLLPHTARIADDLCVVHSLHTEAINHGPAVTFLQTGSQLPGRPSIGAWLDYGLGAENQNLPSFVVMVSKNGSGQPLQARLWGSGFLPPVHQGVQFRGGENPVLYLHDPAGIDRSSRRRMLDALQDLHRLQAATDPHPRLSAIMEEFELAYRMQMAIPDATNVADEPEYIFREYGEDARDPGTFAANCLLARRLAERGVRFIQLYHQGWDHHGELPKLLPLQCKATDQASAALVTDLKRRGLLEDTLVLWGGEFGRTNYCQGKLHADSFGRDHHPRCFSIWMAGGGVRAGLAYGETDPLSYNVIRDPVHIHDLQATLLHLLGIDHEQLTYKFQGRRFRLTDVHGRVVQPLIA